MTLTKEDLEALKGMMKGVVEDVLKEKGLINDPEIKKHIFYEAGFELPYRCFKCDSPITEGQEFVTLHYAEARKLFKCSRWLTEKKGMGYSCIGCRKLLKKGDEYVIIHRRPCWEEVKK